MEKSEPDKLQKSCYYLEELKQLLQDSCLLGKEEMLNYLIDLGRKLDPKSSASFNFNQTNLVQGCQSLVYIDLKKTPENSLIYYGYSDSLIINGFLAILFKSFNGLSCSQAKELWSKMYDFVRESGLPSTFTPNRRMGLIYILDFSKALQEREC